MEQSYLRDKLLGTVTMCSRTGVVCYLMDGGGYIMLSADEEDRFRVSSGAVGCLFPKVLQCRLQSESPKQHSIWAQLEPNWGPFGNVVWAVVTHLSGQTTGSSGHRSRCFTLMHLACHTHRPSVVRLLGLSTSQPSLLLSS